MDKSSVQLKTRRGRLSRLRLLFSASGVDAILVTHLPNINYLCGFTGSAGILLVESDRAVLFTDSRYTFQCREEVSGAEVRIVSGGLIRGVGEALRGGRRKLHVAYSANNVTVGQKRALTAAAGTRVGWVAGLNEVERLRAVKDAGELALMRDAAKLISDVWTQAVRKILPGITELRVAADLEYGMKAGGASGPSFETIVASGPRSARAHARATAKLLRKNELVVMDQGAILRGYCSDMTRTVFLGRPSHRVRRLYRAVLDAQQAAKAAIEPGVTAGEVDAAARQTLKQHKLDQYFTHSTGHGLGLEVHEVPRLARGEKFVLEEGMVVTIEPGVYIEGLGGIRIEDEVVVTSNGAAELTSATRELLEL
ncbi:MAG TPA: Xaa-Pro peptidase family protein [Candidatus Acidoferrales bacterium]